VESARAGGARRGSEDVRVRTDHFVNRPHLGVYVHGKVGFVSASRVLKEMLAVRRGALDRAIKDETDGREKFLLTVRRTRLHFVWP
jgi:hypothetical protein